MDTETPVIADIGRRPDAHLHCAVFYRGAQDYLDNVVPFILDGLSADEPVTVAVPAGNLALLRDALGDAAASVSFSDMGQLGANPARTFPALARFCDSHPGRRVRVVAEPIWPSRTADEYPACVHNEALYNAAFAGRDVVTLCPYDAEALTDDVLADACSTHPWIWNAIDGQPVPSPRYAPDDLISRYNQPLPADPTAATLTVRTFDDLSAARAFAAEQARSIGMADDRVQDLQLIVTELATNSLKYTDGPCRIAIWTSGADLPGGDLICQVSDTGRLDDPLAGRREPDWQSTSGRGLLLVNALADLVRTHTTEDGTTIRTYLRLPGVKTAA